MYLNSGNSKYDIIVKTAYNLFWRYGISRVSIEEICREAGVSKMTFYRFFANKIELGKTIIDNIMDESIEKYTSLMQQDISFEEKIKQQLLLKFEGTKEISTEFVKDVYSNKKLGLHAHWQKRTDEFIKTVKNDYAKAQKDGFIRKDLNLEFMFYFNSKTTDLLMEPKFIEMFASMQELIMEYAKLFFYGIFSHKNEKNEL